MGLICLCVVLVLIYTAWVILTLRYHCLVLYGDNIARVAVPHYILFTGGANYVPYSCLLISNKFCNGGGGGGSGPARAIKFLYAPAPPPPSVWALKPPSWVLVHKTTYDLYSPVHNVLDACISITWASGRGLGPGIHGAVEIKGA